METTNGKAHLPCKDDPVREIPWNLRTLH